MVRLIITFYERLTFGEKVRKSDIKKLLFYKGTKDFWRPLFPVLFCIQFTRIFYISSVFLFSYSFCFYFGQQGFSSEDEDHFEIPCSLFLRP